MNKLLMDENRRNYEKRAIRKPKPYYAAYYDAFGNRFNENHERTDYKVNEKRDIDEQGNFMATRVF